MAIGERHYEIRMKKILVIAFSLLACFREAQAQEVIDDSLKSWEFNVDVNFYFFKDDFFVLPVFKADKNKLHLEARYNYEDKETFSGWAGYNFNGGEEFSYVITPMLGGVVGQTKGIAPGMEITLTYKKLEFYTEMENVFDLNESQNNFFYNWSDITYAPKEWLWVGISAQRTRLYETDLEIQRGIQLGGGLNWWELNAYVYNMGFDEVFFLFTLSASF